ncbi:hypothetical protein HanPSC8_Chr03g0106831 [Helianthus annuus]|nr:hypothetical protein HanPSC8_Chr03g0106831 [Helianthus annuus]
MGAIIAEYFAAFILFFSVWLRVAFSAIRDASSFSKFMRPITSKTILQCAEPQFIPKNSYIF